VNNISRISETENGRSQQRKVPATESPLIDCTVMDLVSKNEREQTQIKKHKAREKIDWNWGTSCPGLVAEGRKPVGA
jgi:hypothetical protein